MATLFPTMLMDMQAIIEEYSVSFPTETNPYRIGRQISRMIHVFLRTPAVDIDRELVYIGFYPKGFDKKTRDNINDLFRLFSNQIKALFPFTSHSEIRQYLIVGYLVSVDRPYLVISDSRYGETELFMF